MGSSFSLPLLTIPSSQPLMITCCWPHTRLLSNGIPGGSLRAIFPAPLLTSIPFISFPWKPEPRFSKYIKNKKRIPFGLKSYGWIYSQISSWLKQGCGVVFFPSIICLEFRCVQAQPLGSHRGQRRALLFLLHPSWPHTVLQDQLPWTVS